ncbi:MAG: hypothetical protein JWM80_2355, partial [Cyanobacteria bacterium RYN_339]|nr:hypothetical protein [Cyanobacteria bacterium RYN_339]
ARRAAWRKAHPNATARRRKPGAAKPNAPKPAPTPTTKP